MKILITAGPTREYIDPVRFITNRSSGKMGYALARAAHRRGFETVLVTGPVDLEAPAGVEVVRIESAAEMAAAVAELAPSCDAVVMAAAVADYRPVEVSEHKLKKQPGDLTLRLERTEDVLASLGAMKQPGQLLVGFAAETEDLVENASDKLRRKNLDWIVANKVSDGFGADTNKVILLGRGGEVVELPLAPKLEVAEKILGIIFGQRPE
jgi:phosphopantothenoylcysteine decarboxylase/phosphopantothenate--cysteine ligase